MFECYLCERNNFDSQRALTVHVKACTVVREKDNVHQTNLQNDSQSCNNDEVGDGDIFPSDENEALESLEDIDRCSVYSTDLSESKSVSSMQDEIALHEDQGHQSEEVVDQGQSEEVISAIYIRYASENVS